MARFSSTDLQVWSKGHWVGVPPPEFTGISTDSRAVKPGELFLALKGQRFDGHDFLADAIARGAAAVVVAEDRASDVAVPTARLVVRDTLKALHDIAAGYRQTLSATFIGITGSTGKTTVKEMCAAILGRVAITAKTEGNWNNDIGLPLSLLRMPREAHWGVFELGINHPGEMKPLCEVLQPHWGMVSNIGPVHTEFFQSLEAIALEKGEVLRCLPASGVAFLDTGGPFYDLLRAQTRARIVTVGTTPAADYVLSGYDATIGTFEVWEKATGEKHRLSLSVPGYHMVANALFAIAVGRVAGVPGDVIVKALKEFRPLAMRWTESDEWGVHIVNDAYNANPISMVAALETFANIRVQGKRWLVLGGMRELGDRTASEHTLLGKRIASGSWGGLITVGTLGRLIAEGARQAGMPSSSVFVCETHEEAAEILFHQVKAGDAMLFKGSRGETVEKVLEKWRRLMADSMDKKPVGCEHGQQEN